MLLPGGGATEIELASKLSDYARTCPGIEQYAIQRYAETFEYIPKILAENSGVKSTEILAKLYVGHHDNPNLGFVIGKVQSDTLQTNDITYETGDVKLNELYDLFITKKWAILFATKAACTVLSVDEIICAKPAGGPKPKENKGWDNDD
jgi:T-complex protein 1 subunit theta